MKVKDILSLERSWTTMKDVYKSAAYMHIPIPIICSRSFANAEYITDELSRFLYNNGILRQINTHQNKYLSHLFVFIPQSEKRFSGVQDIYNHLRKAGGYYGNYRGVILIDVTEWIGHFKEKYFDILLSYLSDLRMNSLIPFFYMGCRNADIEAPVLEAAISPYFRSFRIFFGPSDLYDYMISRLHKSNIDLTENASHYLNDYIQSSSKSTLFHGVDSIRQICDEIAIRSANHHDRPILLDAPLLKEIFSSTGFSDVFTKEEERVIGFR